MLSIAMRAASLILLTGLLFPSDITIAAGLERNPNTTLDLPSSPPRHSFTTALLSRGLSFSSPVAITSPPNDPRLFIVEKPGRIRFLSSATSPVPQLFMDISGRVDDSDSEEGLLGLAFHPNYAENGYFYVFYTTTGQRRDRLSRFQVSSTDPNQGNPNSELILIDQVDDASNHNGGDLHFGPDGYLYVSLGDEGAGNDSLDNSQRINKDFFAGILRIDVDKKPGSLAPNSHPAATSNYSVPPDNPFVGATSFNGQSVNPNQVRTEFWAVGLRNPWRMSFDPVTGDLWVGDVGQGAREEIDIIVKGGNYGWNFREGTLNGPENPPVPSAFNPIEPVFDYARSQGYSVTGGVVYRGEKYPDLYGKYVFADYGSGNIWALTPNGMERASAELIAQDAGITGFGVDPATGDILMTDLQGPIKRLVSDEVIGEPFPEKLSDTGAFADLISLTPEAGIHPYSINVPFWSDGATKQRWFMLPEERTFGFADEGPWTYPVGAVWIKHFDIALTNGVPESTRRLETRFLVRHATGVYGITYRWNEEQTGADLVPAEGMNEEITIHENDGAPRAQTWRYPSRVECLRCHTDAGGLVLGFNTPQLNRPADYGDETINQIIALSEGGFLNQEAGNPHALRVLAQATDESFSREYRVRSYLQVNCAQCHQPGGPAQAHFNALVTVPTRDAGLINGDLVNNQRDNDRKVLVPGSLDDSELLRRVSTLGPGRMPPLASHVLDQDAIALLEAWITEDLPNRQFYPDWQAVHFTPPTALEARQEADADSDGASNELEFLTGTNPNDPSSIWLIDIANADGQTQITFPRQANRAYETEVTNDLFSNAWQSVNHPSNRPFFFPAEDGIGTVEADVTPGEARYYRVRVRQP